MPDRPTAIERAYVLAASGMVKNTAEIKQVLRAEGYPEEGQLHGSTIGKELSKLIADAKTVPGSKNRIE